VLSYSSDSMFLYGSWDMHKAHQRSSLRFSPTKKARNLIDVLRRDPEALAEVVSRAGPGDVRRDGWTPFARRLTRARTRVVTANIGTIRAVGPTSL